MSQVHINFSINQSKDELQKAIEELHGESSLVIPTQQAAVMLCGSSLVAKNFGRMVLFQYQPHSKDYREMQVPRQSEDCYFTGFSKLFNHVRGWCPPNTEGTMSVLWCLGCE